MRYKDYIWPHNPATYSITFERQIAVHKVPFGRYYMQDLGMSCRVMRGQGEFSGEGAYDEIKKLASIFYAGGPGLLIHPLWQISNTYFTALKLEQEPLPDYVRYSFEFRERFDGYSDGLTVLGTSSTSTVQALDTAAQATTYSVVSGDTLWGISKQYNVALEDLLRANPGIKNPNLIHVGEEVVIP
ncbi:MAG: LysM peptidoglycan-binding domain-containing protein [Oscillospiraceae bacterium]|nr:LysM peptidoglycan-binding domain-containing protein [Oscillospiraceae bacterium]